MRRVIKTVLGNIIFSPAGFMKHVRMVLHYNKFAFIYHSTYRIVFSIFFFSMWFRYWANSRGAAREYAYELFSSRPWRVNWIAKWLLLLLISRAAHVEYVVSLNARNYTRNVCARLSNRMPESFFFTFLYYSSLLFFIFYWARPSECYRVCLSARSDDFSTDVFQSIASRTISIANGASYAWFKVSLNVTPE